MQRPAGLGIDHRLRSLAGFLGVADGMSDREKAQMAIAVYAVSRTVHSCREHSGSNPLPLLRLHAKFASK